MASGKKVPTVLMHRLQDDSESFEIVHERYVELIREPGKISKFGYVGKEVHHLLNEQTTRSELRDFFGLDESTIAATIEHARADAEARRRDPR